MACLRRIQTEFDRQLQEVCEGRSVAKLVKKRRRSLPCALHTEIAHPGRQPASSALVLVPLATRSST